MKRNYKKHLLYTQVAQQKENSIRLTFNDLIKCMKRKPICSLFSSTNDLLECNAWIYLKAKAIQKKSYRNQRIKYLQNTSKAKRIHPIAPAHQNEEVRKYNK